MGEMIIICACALSVCGAKDSVARKQHCALIGDKN